MMRLTVRTVSLRAGSRKMPSRWQNVSGGTSGVAHKGMLYAAKALAGAAVDLFTQPELLEKAKAEFQQAAAKGYTCPIEPDAVPVPVEEML